MYSNVIETWEGSRVSSEELLHTPPCDLLTVVPVEWRPLDIFCHHSERGEQAVGTWGPCSNPEPSSPGRACSKCCLGQATSSAMLNASHSWDSYLAVELLPCFFLRGPQKPLFSCGRLTNKMIPGASGVILGCGWSCEPRLCQGRLDVSINKPARVEPQGHLLKRGETKFNACTLSPWEI